MVHLALLNQVLHCSRYIFDRHVQINAVLIEEIDVIRPRPLVRGLRHSLDLLRPAIQADDLAILNIKAELACNQHPVAHRRQSFADQLFIRMRAISFGWTKLADSPRELVENIRAMVDAIGIDHVGIGTDTDLLSSRVGQGANQAWAGLTGGFFYAVVGEMLLQSFTPGEISKVGGGNFCRVFGKVTAGHA